MGKVLRKIPGVRNVAKVIDKVVPREIKPALPFILPFIPGIGPALSSMQGALASKLAFAGKFAPYLAQGITAAGTQALTQENAKAKDLLLTGALAAAPGALSEGLGSLKEAGQLPEFMTKVGKGKDAVSAYEKLQSTLQPETFLGKAGIVATQTGLSQAPIIARMNEQALRDYEAQLREQGIMDSAERRNKIFGYFSNAGYDSEEVNSFLDKYGYAYGGRVGYQGGGKIGMETLYRGPMTAATRRVVDRIEGAVPNEDDENYEDDDGFKIYPKGTTSTYDLNLDAFKDEDEGEEKLAKALRRSNYDLSKGLQSAVSGLEMAFGRPIDMRPERTRFGLADGGLMNLRTGEMPAEMDMRGGGFIPIGAKERADDIPARLSKNEFVMTADAVRAAGGGSINKGAKRMYDLMNKLESKV